MIQTGLIGRSAQLQKPLPASMRAWLCDVVTIVGAYVLSTDNVYLIVESAEGLIGTVPLTNVTLFREVRKHG